MSKIVITTDGCDKNNVSLGEILLLLFYNGSFELNKTIDSLVEKGYITRYCKEFREVNGFREHMRVTDEGVCIVNDVIADSDLEPVNTGLALSLKELWPKGKRDGTHYWADSVKLIEKRLKLFRIKYGNYPEDEIYDAAKRYVESFNGDYTYMRSLKYFIMKEVKGAGGDVESTSELLNYIENKDEESDDAWMTRLV